MLIGHKKQWEFLKNKLEANQLSHAYLFTGADGIGKKLFAKEFAEFIGCRFPDLLIVESVNSESSIKNKRDSLEIDIDQIRDAQKFLSYKSYNGGFKIVVIDNAERMNVEASGTSTCEKAGFGLLTVRAQSHAITVSSSIFGVRREEFSHEDTKARSSSGVAFR